MLPAFFIAAALALLPQPAGVVEDRVDTAEINTILQHVEGGLWNQEEVRESLRQIIFWTDGVVRQWTIDRGHAWHAPGEIIFTESGTIYRVHYGTLRITRGFDDPEVENRAVLSETKRVRLGGSK